MSLMRGRLPVAAECGNLGILTEGYWLEHPPTVYKRSEEEANTSNALARAARSKARTLCQPRPSLALRASGSAIPAGCVAGHVVGHYDPPPRRCANNVAAPATLARSASEEVRG
jgi:hypothetical protein